MNIKITKDEARVCIEVTGKAVRVNTIIKKLDEGMHKVGIELDCVCDAWYIKENLDDMGEFDMRERAIFEDDDGVIRDHGMYHYVNLTTDLDGNYIYGCIVMNRKFYNVA